MSRCFPYPPPRHMRNGVRGEAVREPIKLQRGWESTISGLDNKKRKDKGEKKEKKNVKDIKELYVVDSFNKSERSPLPKEKEEEAERSDLTEEHEQPVYSQSQCCSPDSNHTSNKRKKDDTGYITKTHGNILRIRLPLQRHREPGVPLSAQRSSSDKFQSQSPQCSSVNFKPGIRELCSGAMNTDLKEEGNSNVSIEKKEQKVDSLYKALIEEWIAPTHEIDQNDFDDQEWLFGAKKQGGHGHKRCKLTHGDESCHGSPTLWPCARHLPEADVYALPFTVPF